MHKITLFSFGYHGWGTSTGKLVQLVDAIEEERGFNPAIFVDCRIRREVRAPGFRGDAFERTVGKSRYRWMKSLGNRSIVEDTADDIVIDHPEAADSLLDLALLSSRDKRRIIFFCSCQRQLEEGDVRCHRWEVGELVLATAREREVPVEVVEWPGGASRSIELTVTKPIFECVSTGRRYIPLPRGMDLGELAGPAWATVAAFRCGDESQRAFVGPLMWRNGKWHLQTIHSKNELGTKLSEWRAEAEAISESEGRLPRRWEDL